MARNQDPSSRKLTPAKLVIAILLGVVAFGLAFFGARACTSAVLSASAEPVAVSVQVAAAPGVLA